MSIKSFSSLKSVEKYESGEFEAGGYKWKLVLFPNGNNNHDVKDYISLYLEMAGDKAIGSGKIVTIDYKLFLLNRHKGKESYLVLEDSNKKEKKYCVYRTIVAGFDRFDRFIPLEEFSDASNGYLLDDRCEFGAEVLVSKTTRKGKGECLFMNLNTLDAAQLWTLRRFSYLGDKKIYLPFTSTYYQKYCTWRLKLYRANDKHLALFLQPYKLPHGSKIFAEFTLRIMDQIHGNHCSRTTNAWFVAGHPKYGAWGYNEMITHEENARFPMDDSCKVEAEVTTKGLYMPRVSTHQWPWNSQLFKGRDY